MRHIDRSKQPLTPMEDDDVHLSPELQERIDKGLQEIEQGKTKRYTMDELKQLMGL